MKKFLLLVTVAVFAAYLAFRATGVAFTLKNVGAEALRSVSVEVTGTSYALEDIAPGASKTVRVNPAAASDIKLRFPDGRTLTVDCYMEHNYGGSIEAKLGSQGVVAVKDDVTLPYHAFFSLVRALIFWK